MFRYLKPVFTFLPYAFWCYFRWIRKNALNPENSPIEERYQKVSSLIKHLNKGLDVDVHVVGRENIPEGINYFVSNHIGGYDPLLIIREANKPVGVVAKIEVKKYLFVGKLIQSIDGVFIKRDDIKQTLKEMIKVRYELEEGVKSWLIFPEGTRNRDDKKVLRPFHAGSFKPATATNTPIVPVVVYGTQRITRFNPVYKRYPVYLEFCKPIYPKEYASMSPQELADHVRNIIQQKLTFKARMFDHEEMSKLHSRKYKYYRIK
ncbi:MAG: 1-acyl-sn-glycerol-3-phosphate acyltransferase [Bacilli bacterium]|nr:1-acyl-sn-glycerol-3-phosphate acyltransferase [Bacilli bacterium]MBO4682897.1 1-acyl-sn-glycerol-3-phosphate acyltransferase [Bacilli bacterium]